MKITSVKYLPALIILFILSCKSDNTTPATPVYTTMININGSVISNQITGNIYQDTLLAINFTYNTPDNLVHQTTFQGFPGRNGSVNYIETPKGFVRINANYNLICCVGYPDDILNYYHLLASDSSKNNFRININTSTQGFSGDFKATFVNIVPPYDTVKMQCDTFYCVY